MGQEGDSVLGAEKCDDKQDELSIDKSVLQKSHSMGKSHKKHKWPQEESETDSSPDSSSSSNTSSTSASSKKSGTSRASSRTSKSSRFYGSDSDSDSSGSAKSGRKHSKFKHVKSKRKRKGIRSSGMYDKANIDIVHKIKWPHRGLEFQFRAKSVEFSKLTYNQYIAGETKIIALEDYLDQAHGRLRIMNKIAYAMEESNNNWDACRDYYAAIMVALEMDEEAWTSSFRRFDSIMLPRKVAEDRRKTFKNSSDNRIKKRIPEVVFCKEYNRGTCPQDSSHMGRYKDEKKRVLLEHCYAKCLLKTKER